MTTPPTASLAENPELNMMGLGGTNQMGYLLGIDLGTSSVRATLVAPEGGDVVEIAARQYPISIPRSDWAEQDPPSSGGNRHVKQ